MQSSYARLVRCIFQSQFVRHEKKLLTFLSTIDTLEIIRFNYVRSMMDIKLSGLTLSQWKEIEVDIDSMELHNKVYGRLTAEAKEELEGVIKDFIKMGMEDARFADTILGETPESLKKIAGKSYDKLLLCHPSFTWSMLTMYVVGQVDEIETSDNTAKDDDIVIYGCPYCFWHPVGHQPI